MLKSYLNIQILQIKQDVILIELDEIIGRQSKRRILMHVDEQPDKIKLSLKGRKNQC
jgi:hypothetical protein